jgi:hypothetical protein
MIKMEKPFVEDLFARHKALPGKDFPGYRNHVYRTIAYAMHFLGNAKNTRGLSRLRLSVMTLVSGRIGN